MKRTVTILIAAFIFLVPVAIIVGFQVWWHANYYVKDHTDYGKSRQQDDLKLVDDRLEEKNPQFDSTSFDSRPLDNWHVNKSAAVIKLDCPDIKPDRDGELLQLRASYAAAIRVAEKKGFEFLPSANLVDGAAKQFDDGLYAAMELACFHGELGISPAAPALIEAIFNKLPTDSPALPFVAAALELAGRQAEILVADGNAVKKDWLARFEDNKARSKPISFYTWTPELQKVWRFFRFLQHEFADPDLEIPRAIAAVLKDEAELLEDYRAINQFYGRLTNPLICLSVDTLIASESRVNENATSLGARRATVAVFPPSTSRESELFERLFRQGLPPNVNLMTELIRRIRSGEVDLSPDDDDGWYQYQVFALETMVLPSNGTEDQKLLLTAKYKKRLIEAFKSLITKRRETHARGLVAATDKEALGRGEVKPRLRIEPCATYYLRTARAYSFLRNFLLATIGEQRLADLHGLRKSGNRAETLDAELTSIINRFYGFYLVACEDIGMQPQFLKDESVDQKVSMETATKWLEQIGNNADLSADTRVSVPIFISAVRGKTRLWATLGVRLARLNTSYARPPMIRPADGSSDWQEVERYQLGNSSYVIAVDEFAEVEVAGANALTREELRAICDQHKTKEEIIKALSAQ